jgi:uncharacterized membrane protein
MASACLLGKVSHVVFVAGWSAVLFYWPRRLRRSSDLL